MSATDVIKAWKDEEYRMSLSASALAALPANPVGRAEMLEAEFGPARKQEGMWTGTPDTCDWYCTTTTLGKTTNVGGM